MLTLEAVSTAAIVEALRGIEDPEIGSDIVELGLIYQIEIAAAGRVRVVMMTTTRNCPASAFIVEAVKAKIEQMESVSEASVDLVHDPAWSPEMIGKGFGRSRP